MSLPSPQASSNTTNTFHVSAPLPSPTNSVPQHFYFPPSSSAQRQTQPAVTDQQPSGNQYLQPSIPQQQQQEPQQKQDSHVPQEQQARAPSMEHDSIPHRQDPSSPLRREFGLLAEAAKRAQMAVLTRDLGEVGL